jgi:ferrochelatase
MKHSAPFIEDAVIELAGKGATQITGIVLAPHYSSGSIAQYAQRATQTAAEQPGSPEVKVIRSWNTQPHYVAFLAGALRELLAGFGPELAAQTHVLFTAHSLPVRVVADGDPYPDQLRETAEAVAAAASIERWSIAWQSAGRTADPWIGPDVLDALDELAAGGAKGAIVCSAGFVTDHLEVLYDLDIEAKTHAEKLGLTFARTPSPNADPLLIAALTDVVLAELAG